MLRYLVHVSIHLIKGFTANSTFKSSCLSFRGFFLRRRFSLGILDVGSFSFRGFFLRRRFSLGILDIGTFSFGSFHQNRGLSGSILDIRTFPDRGIKGIECNSISRSTMGFYISLTRYLPGMSPSSL